MLAHRPAGTSSARRGRARCRAAGRLAMALAAVTCTLLYSAAIMPATWAVNVIANESSGGAQFTDTEVTGPTSATPTGPAPLPRFESEAKGDA